MRLNKITLISLIFLLIFTGSAFGQNQYSQIENSYACQEIMALSELGIADIDDPQAPISRADFAMWLARAVGILPYYPAYMEFNDLDSSMEAYGYIASLVYYQIVAESDRFQPNAELTRQDGAVILYNLIRQTQTELKPDYQITYLDQQEIAAYAQEAVSQITYLGILKGNSDYFYPEQNITQEQAAVIIYKMYKWSEHWAEGQAELNYSELQAVQGEVLNFSEPQFTFSKSFGYNQARMLDIYGLNPQIRQKGQTLLTVNQAGQYQMINLQAAEGKAPANKIKKILLYNYQVTAWSPDNYFAKTEYENYPGAVDGLASNGESWLGYLRQDGRDITVDLGSVQNVDNLAMEFKQEGSSGIRMPAYVNVEVSLDGKLWYQLGRINHNTVENGTSQIVSLALSFPSLNARYFKISFPVEIYTFIRHLRFEGGQAIVAPPILSHAGLVMESSRNNLYLTEKQDIFLLYSNGLEETPISWNQDELTKLVGYVDSSGQIKDTMFDAMLFLPIQGAMTNRMNWYNYLEDLFKPDRQLAALDQAVGVVNQALGLTRQYPVILTLPYPNSEITNFEASDGEKTLTSFSANEQVTAEQAYNNRLQAVKAYYKKMLLFWQEAAYANLKLDGIYWYAEEVDTSVNRESELVRSVAKMVRTDGYDFYWIPYYGAAGYDCWQNYGFTCVILQPNYFSATKPGEGRMEAAAALSRANSMGIEIELDDKITYNRYYYDLFYKQLDLGHKLGLDKQVTNAYYASSRTLANILNSRVDLVRNIYDDLYRWIKGTYV